MNYKDTLNALAEDCYQRSKNSGWWDNPATTETVPAKLCLVHSEISEAMEGARKNLQDDKLPHRKMVEVELADAIIRIMDLSGFLGLDIGGALEEKMDYNLHRLDHKREERAKEGGKKF